MDWVQDMTARWVRIMSAAGGGSTPVDEAVRQISEIGGAPGRKIGLGRLNRNAATPAEASAVTVLSRQLIAGVLVSDWMIDRLCALAGRGARHSPNRFSMACSRCAARHACWRSGI